LGIKWQSIRRKLVDREIILVADETTISKAGKATYGLGYFYATHTRTSDKKYSVFEF
jgi:hypothetical protein